MLQCETDEVSYIVTFDTQKEIVFTLGIDDSDLKIDYYIGESASVPSTLFKEPMPFTIRTLLTTIDTKLEADESNGIMKSLLWGMSTNTHIKHKLDDKTIFIAPTAELIKYKNNPNCLFRGRVSKFKIDKVHGWNGNYSVKITFKDGGVAKIDKMTADVVMKLKSGMEILMSNTGGAIILQNSIIDKQIPHANDYV
jgi:ribosomal protein L35AE/L33A